MFTLKSPEARRKKTFGDVAVGSLVIDRVQNTYFIYELKKGEKKSHIRETRNLLTYADSSPNTFFFRWRRQRGTLKKDRSATKYFVKHTNSLAIFDVGCVMRDMRGTGFVFVRFSFYESTGD